MKITPQNRDKVAELLPRHIAGHLKSLVFMALPYRDDINDYKSEPNRGCSEGGLTARSRRVSDLTDLSAEWYRKSPDPFEFEWDDGHNLFGSDDEIGPDPASSIAYIVSSARQHEVDPDLQTVKAILERLKVETDRNRLESSLEWGFLPSANYDVQEDLVIQRYIAAQGQTSRQESNKSPGPEEPSEVLDPTEPHTFSFPQWFSARDGILTTMPGPLSTDRSSGLQKLLVDEYEWLSDSDMLALDPPLDITKKTDQGEDAVPESSRATKPESSPVYHPIPSPRITVDHFPERFEGSGDQNRRDDDPAIDSDKVRLVDAPDSGALNPVQVAKSGFSLAAILNGPENPEFEARNTQHASPPHPPKLRLESPKLVVEEPSHCQDCMAPGHTNRGYHACISGYDKYTVSKLQGVHEPANHSTDAGPVNVFPPQDLPGFPPAMSSSELGSDRKRPWVQYSPQLSAPQQANTPSRMPRFCEDCRKPIIEGDPVRHMWCRSNWISPY
ncbi:hypothetical protein TWF718_010100 [Orbilia javanica]|uniref:Uncharacterized protein n=1 Tax=Orbilia javanica TaxID=47235 RepID=A0AAN8RDH2_9PEZI